MPRGKIHSFANIWMQRIQRSKNGLDGYTSRVLDSCAYSRVPIPGTVPQKRWITNPRTPNAEGGRNQNTMISATPSIASRISGEFVESTNLNPIRIERAEAPQVLRPDLHGQSSENKDLASRVTYLVMDVETTGFNRFKDRIIEIAIKDLRGGRNSTFQTLINPDCHVPNSNVHGITTCMVNGPEVPRMKDLIPILIKYVESRQKPGGHVVFIVHHGQVFDVPFLKNEFRRCSSKIPSNWLYLDTLRLCREAIKFENRGSKVLSKVSLQAVREHYKIPLVGQAHRAMSDVDSLAQIFQKITFDLKLHASSILERCFKASDVK